MSWLNLSNLGPSIQECVLAWKLEQNWPLLGPKIKKNCCWVKVNWQMCIESTMMGIVNKRTKEKNEISTLEEATYSWIAGEFLRYIRE